KRVNLRDRVVVRTLQIGLSRAVKVAGNDRWKDDTARLIASLLREPVSRVTHACRRSDHREPGTLEGFSLASCGERGGCGGPFTGSTIWTAAGSLRPSLQCEPARRGACGQAHAGTGGQRAGGGIS